MCFEEPYRVSKRRYRCDTQQHRCLEARAETLCKPTPVSVQRVRHYTAFIRSSGSVLFILFHKQVTDGLRDGPIGFGVKNER